jgi:hypothetical protein
MSCVTKTEFKTQLQIVQQALVASLSPSKRRQLPSYKEICEPYGSDEDILVSLREADDERQFGDFEDTMTARYAVLCWVLEASSVREFAFKAITFGSIFP